MSFIGSLRSQGRLACKVTSVSSHVMKQTLSLPPTVPELAASFWSSPPIHAEDKDDKKAASSSARKPRKTTVTTNDLVKAVAEKHDLSHSESRRIIDTVFNVIVDAVTSEKAISISNFGSFDTYKSKSRTARNPRTNETVLVPAKERIRFRAYNGLKQTLSGVVPKEI